MIKPTEIRLVAGLLQQEHPDSEALAKEIIQSLDAKRKQDDGFVVVYQWSSSGRLVTCAYGPYTTLRQAQKTVSSLVSPGPDLGRAMIVKVTDLPE